MAKTSGTGIGKVLDDEDNGSRHELSSTGARTMLRSNTALALRGKYRCPMCKSKTAVLNMQHVWSECHAAYRSMHAGWMVAEKFDVNRFYPKTPLS